MGAALNTLPGASKKGEVVINQPTLTLDLQIPWHRLGLVGKSGKEGIRWGAQ